MIKMAEFVCWKDVRKEFMSPEEQAECDEWLTELDKIVLAHDAGEISAEEYWRLCFELDKKFGLADEEDADIYLGAEDEENFSEQISAHV